MHIQYRKRKIAQLVETRAGEEKYPPEIIPALFKVLDIIEAVDDPKEFLPFKGLNYEQLKGKRKGESSMRLNDQWRLTMEISEDSQGFFAEIIDIEDYH